MNLMELAQPTLEIAPTASARDAIRAMSEKKVDVAAVVEDRRIVGIVTEKDLAKLGAGLESGDPHLLVRDAMGSGPVRTLPASEPVLDAAKLMRAERIRHLALVDSTGAFIALVSLRRVLYEVMDELDLKVDNLERELMADGPGG